MEISGTMKFDRIFGHTKTSAGILNVLDKNVIACSEYSSALAIIEI